MVVFFYKQICILQDDEKSDKDKKRPSSRNSAKKGSQKGKESQAGQGQMGQSAESIEIPLEDQKFWKVSPADVHYSHSLLCSLAPC